MTRATSRRVCSPLSIEQPIRRAWYLVSVAGSSGELKAQDLQAEDEVVVRCGQGRREHRARVIRVTRERVTGGHRNLVWLELQSGTRLKLSPRSVVRIVRAARRRRFDAGSMSVGIERLGSD